MKRLQLGVDKMPWELLYCAETLRALRVMRKSESYCDDMLNPDFIILVLIVWTDRNLKFYYENYQQDALYRLIY